MKLRVGNNFLLTIILAYPIILAIPFFFKTIAFGITTPFFALISVFIVLKIFQQKKLFFNRTESINLSLALLLVVISFFNFSTFRYSLPIFFSCYVFLLYLFLVTIYKEEFVLDTSIVRRYLVSYIILSIILLFFDHGYMSIGNRFIGITGSPTTFSGILVAVYIVFDAEKHKWSIKRTCLYLTVLFFVFLTKTRLILVFFLAYPILLHLIKRKALNKGLVFWVFLFVLFVLYGLYGIVVEEFPELVTSRYNDARDASFGLRYELYRIVEQDFLQGSLVEKLWGKGNEHSRLLVLDRWGKDLFPHNDFIRVLNDWGIIGAGVFVLLVYRIAKKTLSN